jgi:hypothetical protein
MEAEVNNMTDERRPIRNQPNDNPRLLDTAEAAQRLRMARITLELWRQKGVGPKFCRWGRTVRYDPRELDRFIAESTVKPGE